MADISEDGQLLIVDLPQFTRDLVNVVQTEGDANRDDMEIKRKLSAV